MKSSTSKLVIVGGGETACLACEYFTHDSPFEVVAFAIDREYISGDNVICGLPVVPLDELAAHYPPSRFSAFVAMGSGRLNRQRTQIYGRVKAMGYNLASYVSSKTFVWHDVKIGDNCFILEHNVLQPFSSVGNNVVMWSGNHLGHRSKIGDNCFITSHVVISGFCSIGRNTFMGVNSCVADEVSIGDDNFIAMGACVNKSTGEDEIYRGNPAMKVKLSAKMFCRVGRN